MAILATSSAQAPAQDAFHTSRWSLFIRFEHDIESIITDAEDTLVSLPVPVASSLRSALIESAKAFYQKYFELALAYPTELGGLAPEKWAEQTCRGDLADHLRMPELAIPPHEWAKHKDRPCTGNSKIAEFIKRVCAAWVDVSLHFIAEEEKHLRRAIDDTLFHSACDAASTARLFAHRLPDLAAPDRQTGNPRKRTLSAGELFAGKLFHDAMQKSANGIVSQEALLQIATELDSDSSPFKDPREHLPPKYHKNLSTYNRKNHRAAIKTWYALIGGDRFRSDMERGMRILLSNLGRKYEQSLSK